MTFSNVLAHVEVQDFQAGVNWYTTLLGRAPDRRPMDGCVEWQITGSGGIQLYAGESAPCTVIIGVDDANEFATELTTRGLRADVMTVPSGQFRVATIKDPAQNTLLFTQSMGDE
ncbi:MAG: VOC family protein [Nakamurella sp.]